ncbi:MAG: prepilin-type N-terminal cleavage/methylation domain-containing protein [Patescibacteria group bacterium]
MIKLKAKTYKLKTIRGFTLIELLIYLALVSAVVTTLILWVLNLSGVRNKNYAAAAVAANRQFIASVITREIKQADVVIAPAAGATSATLELKRPGALPDVIFDVTNGTLYLTVVGNPPVAVSGRQVEIVNLEFKNLTGSGDDRENIWSQAIIRYRNPASKEFEYERPLTFTTSNRL